MFFNRFARVGCMNLMTRERRPNQQNAKMHSFDIDFGNLDSQSGFTATGQTCDSCETAFTLNLYPSVN